MIELKNVHKRYQMGDTLISALRGVSLTIEAGDFVAIMGPSGSGKSTLMHCLGLLDVPDEGSYQILGREVSGLGEDDLAILRRRVIGFIFQQFHLLPRMEAVENVALPLFYSEGKMDLVRAAERLRQVGLGDRLHHQSNEMSGGQQQRVAIARCLVQNPLVILADEPTGNLDSATTEEIMNLLRDLNQMGITVVVVTHEEDIGRQARRLIRMRDGLIQVDERLLPLNPSSLPLPSIDWDPVSPNSPPNSPITVSTTISSSSFFSSSFYFLRGWRKWMSFFQVQNVTQGVKFLGINKIRTGLSMLGILIGVGSVVTMMALGQGAQEAIQEQLSSLGSNLLTVRSGAPMGAGGVRMEAGSLSRLTEEDALVIREKFSDLVKEAAPTVSGKGQVTYGGKNHGTSVIGVSPSYGRMHADEPVVGRLFSDSENLQRRRLAIVGVRVLRELFPEDKSPLGEMIKINKVSFQIVGILPEKGMNRFQDQDDRILIPVKTAMHRLFGKNYVDTIDVEVARAERILETQDKIYDLLNTRHHVPTFRQEDAFQIRNMAEIQSILTSSTQIMTLLLSSIAAISLLVGGIGIMNIMLVSVTERTREIGLRKAIGARRWDILTQFLVESIVISGVGGSLGILMAWVATVLIAGLAGWAVSITGASIALAFSFSVGVGVVFGLYPAIRASRLPPIEALRYE